MEAAQLDALVRGFDRNDRHYRVLYCAPDVYEALAERQGKPDAGNIGFTYVTCVMGTRPPGWWKLVLHDRCDVIGGHSVDDAMIATHDDCTVLGESS